MPTKPVDQAIKVILGPCIDDTDFKTREEALTYDQAGMEIDVILEKHDGTIVTTAVIPTVAGDYDWAHTDQGYYELELPASAGISFNNTEEGILKVVGYCTGVLPFSSVSYDVVPEKVYNSLVEGSDNLEVDLTQIGGVAQSATDLKDFADAGYDPVTNKVEGVKLVDTTTTNSDMRGTDNAALAATALTDATWTDAKAGFLDAAISGRAPANEYDTQLDANMSTRAPSGEYDTELDATVSSRSSHTAASVWAVGTRTLTSFGTLIADIWASVTRTLTAIPSGGATEAKQDLIQVEVDGLNGAAMRGTDGANTTVPDVAGTAADLHSTTDSLVSAVGSLTTAVKAKTDNLPSGIAKNVALSSLDVLMVLSSDHVTAATGKTVTGQIRKDSGAFAAITNAITEVGSGWYTIASGLTQAEMNADKIILKFIADDCDQKGIEIFPT